MSTFAVNKLCRDASHDTAFRDALKRDPKSAMAPLALTDEERTALLAGDVKTLFERGAHPYLLSHLIRYELFGLTEPVYSERIHAARDPNL
jgi:hypothetical protein